LRLTQYVKIIMARFCPHMLGDAGRNAAITCTGVQTPARGLATPRSLSIGDEQYFPWWPRSGRWPGLFIVASIGSVLQIPQLREGAMPTYRIVAKYQPKVDHELFGRFLNLVTSSRLKWTHDCNPDGTGHIYKITVHERGRAVCTKDELIKLGMEVELTEVVTRY
jgi:hypothetical protein